MGRSRFENLLYQVENEHAFTSNITKIIVSEINNSAVCVLGVVWVEVLDFVGYIQETVIYRLIGKNMFTLVTDQILYNIMDMLFILFEATLKDTLLFISHGWLDII